MGKYQPSSHRKKTSLAEALQEAEESHLLDCPPAGFAARSAACLLDIILAALLWKAVDQLAGALSGTIASIHAALPPGRNPFEDSAALGRYLGFSLKVAGLFAANVWATAQFGGSVGKLLLGLRVLDALTGQRLGIGRALLRETGAKALAAAPALAGLALMVLRPDGRALHDLLCRSVVKRLVGTA